MVATLPAPPRLASRGGVENIQALLDWTYSVYQILEAEQQILTRVNDIAAVAPLTQTISATPTKAEVEALQSKINELIAAAQAT